MTDFSEAYLRAFESYVSAKGEPALQAAYELGREAVQSGLGILDLADAHNSAYMAAHRALFGEEASEELAGTAGTFFMEALSAFEMVQRGYREVQEMALLEKDHAEQLRRLADASMAIGATLSREEIARVMTDEVRGVMSAGCAYVILGGESRTSVMASGLCRRCRRYLAAADLDGLYELVAASTGPTPLTAADLERYGPWPAVEEDQGTVSLALRLLGAGERPLGSLHIVHLREGEFTDTDRSMLVQMVQIGSAALENARLYEQERHTSVTLQLALLPGRLPRVAGIELTARYEPGTTEVAVGGDWYDVVTLAGGRLGAAIGDIAGHGLRAASSMGQVRMAFRASADAQGSPRSVVERVNRLMCALEPQHFSTMAYLIVDPSSGDTLITRAGHPPPLVVDGDGGVRYADVGLSVALGIDPRARFDQGRISLEPGSTLLLYTDGLLGRHLTEPTRELTRVVAEAATPLEEMCDQILEALLPERLQDDVALLALRLNPQS